MGMFRKSCIGSVYTKKPEEASAPNPEEFRVMRVVQDVTARLLADADNSAFTQLRPAEIERFRNLPDSDEDDNGNNDKEGVTEVMDIPKVTTENWHDEAGNPAGGVAFGTGFCISWQNGPLGRGVDRKEPNGAFTTTVLQAVLARYEHYQSGKFACDNNAKVIELLKEAISVNENRTKTREDRGVEGTHKA